MCLTQVADLESAVSSARGDFGPILNADRRPFFPEYTDHGIAHVESVLSTAVALARDESRQLLTPQDAAVLVTATVLHDIAMQLTETGFLALVLGQVPDSSIPWFKANFNEKPWPELWREFQAEAVRFSGRQNQRLFGSPEPVPSPDLSHPSNLTQTQRLLIGEFLRRHHGRLAHEIAIHGFPGPAGTSPIVLSPKFGAYRDIAGVVARSHALPLRPCADYLKGTYGDLRTPRCVHAVFLMGLLRVADYLQVESERAPKQLMRVRALASPVSAGEWRMHHAVVHVHQAGDDREALVVHAQPQDVSTYLKLKDLLAGIQSELDHTWAVLGEIFGPVPDLHALGLTIRRVRSNLDDEPSFAATVPFVPEYAAFEAADAELLKLLVGPLYGDDPAIAVRELVQNAVDAVLELRDYLTHHPDHAQAIESTLPTQSHDVVVSLETDAAGEHWLRVTDKGRGMTVEVIRDYFLRAGASFRMSDAWRREFEDDKGHSRVLRSGRFGIGALAAFLLGEQIEVVTRPIERQDGISFSATLDTAPIELRHIQGASVGTTVRVKLSETTYNTLKDNRKTWDWYYLRNPSVQRVIEGQPVNEGRRGFVPPQDAVERPWFRLPQSDHMGVDWTYDDRPRLCCNGIVVIKEDDHRALFNKDLYELRFRRNDEYAIRPPHLSICDPDGHLPLSLDRLSLRSRCLSFEEALLEDIARNIVAYAVCKAPDAGLEHSTAIAWYFNDQDEHKGIVGSRHRPETNSRPLCWFSTNFGIAPADPSLIDQIAPHALICAVRNPGVLAFPAPPLHGDYAVFEADACAGKGDTVQWLRLMLEPERTWLARSPSAFQVFLGHHWVKTLNVLDRLPQKLLRRIVMAEHDGYVVICSKNASKLRLDSASVADCHKNTCHTLRLAELVYPHDRPRVEPSTLCRIWMQYVGGAVPLDKGQQERLRDRLHAEYPEMRPHIEYWCRERGRE